MKYNKLVEGIKKFEDSFWFGECVYFKAIEEIKKRIRGNLSLLKEEDLEQILEKIVKIFLVQWGMMGRTINRKDVDWGKLSKQLRESKEVFKKLDNKSLLEINLEDEEIAKSIKKAYNSAKVKYIGPTAVSKILHLFNPELFVMLDDEIRKEYECGGSAEGYLEFLKKMKEEIEEAIEEKAGEDKCSKKEAVEKICTGLPSDKLGEKYKKKTLAKLIDEYNWWVAHKKFQHS